jgi:hypothetical protein
VKNVFVFSYSEQTPDTPCLTSAQKNRFQQNEQDNECEHRLMTINEIINGSVSFSLAINAINHYYLRMNLLVF